MYIREKNIFFFIYKRYAILLFYFSYEHENRSIRWYSSQHTVSPRCVVDHRHQHDRMAAPTIIIIIVFFCF